MARLLNLKVAALFVKALHVRISLAVELNERCTIYTCIWKWMNVYTSLFHSTSAAQIRNQVSAAFSSDFTDTSTSGPTATDSLTRNLEGSFFMSAIVSGLAGGTVAVVRCPHTCNGTWDHVKLTCNQLCVSIDNWFMCYGRIWMRYCVWLWTITLYVYSLHVSLLSLCTAQYFQCQLTIVNGVSRPDGLRKIYHRKQ